MLLEQLYAQFLQRLVVFELAGLALALVLCVVGYIVALVLDSE